MTVAEILALCETWGPEALKLLKDGLDLLLAKSSEQAEVQAARDAASAAVDVVEAVADKKPTAP
jgi:hypothetical protein